MQPSDFSKDSAGKLVRTVEGAWAFVPAPLPPDLAPSWGLVCQLSEADRALSELAGIAVSLPNPHLLIGPFVRREAVLSSQIEGTQASLKDLLAFEATENPEPHTDVIDVANYVNALEYGLRRVQEIPICLRLIRELHERLMKGTRGEQFTPGEFRTQQNWIGEPGCSIYDASFVPPPVPELRLGLQAFENFLHATPVLPPLIRLAVGHYQFEALHPFLDGNGRIGRLLITLLLGTDKLLLKPLLYLSAFFERHRQEYYRLLLEVSRTGSWEEWIIFFLRAVAEQARDAAARSHRLLTLWQQYRTMLQAQHASGLMLQLLDSLFNSPVVTMTATKQRLKVTARSAQLNIDKLVRAGLLSEITGRQRNRIFVAQEILNTIEAPIGESASHVSKP